METKNLKIKVTGLSTYILFMLIPFIIVYILFLLYLILTSRGEEFDTSMAKWMSAFFPLVFIFITLIGGLPYISVSYCIQNELFIVKKFRKTLVNVNIWSAVGISKYHKWGNSPAFFIRFSVEDNNYLDVPIVCLRNKDSKRLYDIFAEILAENNKAAPSSQ